MIKWATQAKKWPTLYLANKKEKRKGTGDSADPGVGLSRQPLISYRQDAFC
jgi:hypothetical protein